MQSCRKRNNQQRKCRIYYLPLKQEQKKPKLRIDWTGFLYGLLFVAFLIGLTIIGNWLTGGPM